MRIPIAFAAFLAVGLAPPALALDVGLGGAGGSIGAGAGLGSGGASLGAGASLGGGVGLGGNASLDGGGMRAGGGADVGRGAAPGAGGSIGIEGAASIGGGGVQAGGRAGAGSGGSSAAGGLGAGIGAGASASRDGVASGASAGTSRSRGNAAGNPHGSSAGIGAFGGPGLGGPGARPDGRPGGAAESLAGAGHSVAGQQASGRRAPVGSTASLGQPAVLQSLAVAAGPAIPLPGRLLPSGETHEPGSGASRARSLPRAVATRPSDRPVLLACRTALAEAAAPYGATAVDIAQTGSLRRSADGGLSAPVEARIVYARSGRVQVRQARVTCQFDSGGRVVAAL